jgi:hypothetical protein
VREFTPALQAVVDGLHRRRARRHQLSLRDQPAVEDGEHPPRLAVPYSSSLVCGQLLDLALDAEQDLMEP